MSVSRDIGMSPEIPALGDTKEETPFRFIQIAKPIP
jgi:hypothetical protein